MNLFHWSFNDTQRIVYVKSMFGKSLQPKIIMFESTVGGTGVV